MLRAVGIRVRRGEAPILDGVSLALARGEVVAVIGPNGAGKSTLLHALSGALPPEAGRVELDGRELRHWPRQALARRRAVLAQTPALAFPFRVLEVVLLGRGPHAGRVDRRRDLAIAEAAMRETDVLALADRLYTTLSGGERQRVELARVLAQVWPDERGDEAGPRFLLLDEPTNNLDLGHQRAAMLIARRFAGRGLGVVAVLHDPNLAALYADRLCVLAGGRVAACGPVETALSEPLLRQIFRAPLSVARHPEHGRLMVLPA